MSSVALRSNGGWYVSAENGGGGKVSCDKQSVGSWERLALLQYAGQDGEKVAYIRATNGQYFCAENGGGGDVNANRDAANIWETFRVVDAGEGRLAFRTHDGHYLRGAGGALRADATEVVADAKFESVPQPYVWKDLEISFTSNFNPIWTDSGSGAHADGSFWQSAAPNGWFALGDVCVAGHDDPTRKRMVAVVRAAEGSPGSALAEPLEYREVWADHGSGADRDCAVWEPVPPNGYVAMGCVATLGYSPPPTSQVRCVRKDLVTRGPSVAKEPIWTDRGSGADADFSAWHLGGLPADQGQIFVSPGTFLGVNGYDAPVNHPCGYVFKLGILEMVPRRRPGPPAKAGLAPGEQPSDWAPEIVHDTIFLPWYAVRDPGMPDIERMVKSPVYRLDRQDRYHLHGVIDNRGNKAEQSQTFEYTTGFSHSDTENFTSETSIEIKVKESVTAGVPGIASAEAEITTAITQTFIYGTSTKETTNTSETRAFTVKASPGKLVAAYLVKSEARLFRRDGTMVGSALNGTGPDKLVYYEI